MNQNTNINISNYELSELIGQIYAATLNRCWQDFLDRILELTDSNKAFFLLQKIGEPEPVLLEYKANFEYDPKVLQDYQSRADQDPLYAVIREFPEGEVLNCCEYLDIEQFADTEFFQSIYVPMRSYHAMGAVLLRDGVHDSYFIVNRGRDQLAYDAADQNLLQLLSPHLSQAIQIFKTLQLNRNYLNLTQSVLDQTDKAIFVCDEHADIVLKNQQADNALAQGAVVYSEHNKLALRSTFEQQQLQHYIHNCALFSAAEIRCKEAIVIDQPDGTTITITVAPLNGGNDFNPSRQPRCLVNVAASHLLDWPTVIREFSLTPTEAELLQALYRKKKLNDLVEPMQSSYNTLRNHLQAVFKKANVSSQTELMIKLNSFSG